MAKDPQNVQASIVDRLIDREPELSHEPVSKRLQTFDRARESVIRDLENLLNTRGYIFETPAAFVEVGTSVIVYGLPDYTARNPRSPAMKKLIQDDIVRVIGKFEPRLKDVQVEVESQTGDERNIRLRIKAVLMVDPVREPISFDTLFDTNKGEYKIPI